MKNNTCRNSFTRKLIFILAAMLVFSMMLGCTSGMAYAKSKKKTVKIGHARSDEKGTTVGKKPGDQKGGEVASSNFYYRKNTWAGWKYVARANDPEAARAIAKAMKQAVKNNNIGYGKSAPQLSSVVGSVNYNLSLVSTPVNCDCIGLVDVCLGAAGLYLDLDYIEDNDSFTFYTQKAFRKKGTKLQPGDILYTRNKKAHHAAIVIKSSNKITGADPNPTSKYTAGKTYKALYDLSVYRGPGSSYFEVDYSALLAEGNALIVADSYDNDYGYIEKGTQFTCLEARRNYIRTAAGWVLGTRSDGTENVTAA